MHTIETEMLWLLDFEQFSRKGKYIYRFRNLEFPFLNAQKPESGLGYGARNIVFFLTVSRPYSWHCVCVGINTAECTH
jgi:hypothetical protein